MRAYYNEIDPYCVKELKLLIKRGLIADGDVDERSIEDVQPGDLVGYDRCHFFAGIAGWDYALNLARWTGQIWTGSCPCQPFSTAGKQRGEKDKRHLWPSFFRLIRQCKPSVLFGEQVESAIALGWLDSVANDMESENYAFGAAVLPAFAVGAPHKRNRIFFCADSSEHGLQGIQRCAKAQIQEDWSPKALGSWNSASSPFFDWDKLMGQSSVRRIPNGISSGLDVGPRLHAYGNAIVPQVAATFIRSYMECR